MGKQAAEWVQAATLGQVAIERWSFALGHVANGKQASTLEQVATWK